MVICVAEDRQSDEIPVKLLLLSLAHHCPDLQVELFFPPATNDFRDWIAKFPQIRLRTTPLTGAGSWNIKPDALLILLEEGHDEVWWIDSDIILSCDFRRSLGKLSDSTLTLTEEALYGMYRDDSYRAMAWGFKVGRILPFTLNTGVIRATKSHITLLKRWKELLESEEYQKAQNSHINERSFHMHSDQSVLTALLASEEFSEIPLNILRRGTDIIQYFGYAGFTLKERLHCIIKGLPPFIHSQGEKPWHRGSLPQKWENMRHFLYYLRLEASPYNLIASQYQHEVSEDIEWLRCQSMLGKLLSIIGIGSPALTGLPLAIAYSCVRLIKTIVGIDDQFNPRNAYMMVSMQSNALQSTATESFH